MEPTRLIEALSDPAAYPFAVEEVEVHQTHISLVFLAGGYAYKIKKPVNLGFLDFSTLERRRHFCEEEVRLNRRLAPSVYLGVVPVTHMGTRLQVEGSGEAVDWAVKMERLPQEATLTQRLRHGQVEAGLMEELARKLADFHAHAEAGERVSAHARFDAVARTARDNLGQAGEQPASIVHPAAFGRLQVLTEEALSRLRPLIESRANRGVPREVHGDLQLDHVYVFPDRPPPGNLVIVDCIEFSESLRCSDPVTDMAFLVMDLIFQGHRELAQVFGKAYFQASGDAEGQALLPFYTGCRAVVRGKVEGIKCSQPEVPEAERAASRVKARGRWLLALGELEEPQRRPCMVMVGGLPGSGKSTLARGLAKRAGLQVIRSDVVRKAQAGLDAEEPSPPAVRQKLYTPEQTERTYAECLRQAEELLFQGQRVLVDATFGDEQRRRLFLEAASRLAVPAVFLVCQADPHTTQERLEHRSGDASDADWKIYVQARGRWEQPGPLTVQALREISTRAEREQALSQGLAILRDRGLL